ncbi:unnamed protein product [Paramecium primaurelia]|uniref:Sperm-tail PG-rich repeat protein n=1 Tax=Paramecium primaurelia TaxID=5886 RepID=A0A8S1NMW8_PARPR|nr:unnamed protein product [Paramecium primaurelia]
MAFVYQAQRDLNQLLTSVPTNVGPGSYGYQKKKLIKQSVAPFNSQSSRLNPLKNSSFPGPGSYSLNFANAGQKVLLSSNQSELKILEIHKQQSVFASKCKRFQEVNTSDTPGPGYYKPEPIQRQHYQNGSAENFIESLLKLNRNKSIPSIPTNEQVYGYVDGGTLQLNKSPQVVISGLKNDSVGPGHYELKNSFDLNKEKGINWHSSKQPKLAPVISKDQKMIVGPGAYDIQNESQPLYKLMPSGSFQSNTQRFNNLDKGQRSKEILKLQFEKKKSQLLQDPQFEDLKEEQFELNQNEIPGPGYYTKDQSAISTHTKSTSKLETQCFGSKLKRFESDSNLITIGPGDYNIETSLSKSSLSQKYPPFLSSNTRFEQKHMNRKIGPQSYNINQSLEHDLIKKLERSPVGKFGYNQPRFEDDQNKNQLPGPGYYEYSNQSPQQGGAQTVFKSQTKRIDPSIQNKLDIPAPDQYYPRNHTIEFNVKKNEEEDPEFEIQRPPFQSSAPRFQNKGDLKIDEQDEELYEKKHSQKKKEDHKIPYKQKQSPPPFNVQEKRFQNGKVSIQSPGPGEYNQFVNTSWEKPSFNVQFSSII